MRESLAGNAALAGGDVPQAIAHYTLAIEALPGDAQLRFNLGNALAQSGDAGAAAAHLREAVELDPGFAAAHCNLGLALHELGRLPEARDALDRAVELEPDNPDFALNRRVVLSHPVPLWHFSMLNDATRNEAFESAIRASVSPGNLVLEIGTGSGLLAMMAARAGAEHVFSCEMVDALAVKAREIIAKNGLEDRITVLSKHSARITIPEDLPRGADVLAAEIIATDLLGEGFLPSYEDAKARLLAPRARIIPRQAWIRGQLAAATGVDAFTRAGTVRGFDLRSFNDFSPFKVHPGEVEMEVTLLSPPFDIFHFDLEGQAHFPPERKSIAVPVFQPGTCVGVLQWIRLDLGGGTLYENAELPLRRAGHWQQVLHMFPAPLDVNTGETVLITAAHNRTNLLFHARVQPGLSVRITG